MFGAKRSVIKLVARLDSSIQLTENLGNQADPDNEVEDDISTILDNIYFMVFSSNTDEEMYDLFDIGLRAMPLSEFESRVCDPELPER